MTDAFKEIIGQQEAKQLLCFFAESYKRTKIVPPIIFTGPKGYGKTHISRQFARKLTDDDGITPKGFAPVNASSIKDVNYLFDQIITPNINKKITIFIDEASEIPRGPTMALLSILDVEKGPKTSYTHDGNVFNFDLARISWIFATSEPQKIWAPLLNRFERVELKESSLEDLKLIIKNACPMAIEEKALSEIASISSNPRKAMAWANKLAYTGMPVIDYQFWTEIKSKFGIVKFGLNSSELKVLEILRDSGLNSLTSLAAKTTYSRQALQREVEPALMKHGLIEVAVGGRKLTHKGRQYLEDYNIL